jgi:hypothetical protein
MARIERTGTRLCAFSSLDGVEQWRLVFTLATSVPPGTVTTSGCRFARIFPGVDARSQVSLPGRPAAEEKAADA